MTGIVETSALNEIDLRYAEEDWNALCVRFLLSALEAADAAAAAQGEAPAPLGETSGPVAALVTPEGAMTITPSISFGGLNELTGSLTGLLARIPVEDRSRVHGQCCEIAALSDLETTGGTPEGAAISVSLNGGQAEGLSIPICSSYRRIGAELGLNEETLQASRAEGYQ